MKPSTPAQRLALSKRVNRWRKANPDRVREYKRREVERNPKINAERARRWRHENPEKMRLQRQDWNERNAVHVRAKAVAWQKAHPARVKAYRDRRAWVQTQLRRIARETGLWKQLESEYDREHKRVQR